MTTSPTVLAVGPAGHTAGPVVPELARRSARVRGFVRDAAQSDVVRARGAPEVVVGDLRDRSSVQAALEGADAVFYIAPAFNSRRSSVRAIAATCATSR